jgi:hypothetical protein
MTCLHLAIDNVDKVGDSSLVRQLLSYGAKPEIKDRKGRTPATVANELRDSVLKSEILD